MTCHACGGRLASGTTPFFCPSCWQTVRLITGPCCPSCGKPFASEAALVLSPEHVCGDCREKQPPYTQAFSAAYYEGVMAQAIKIFKYKRRSRLARPLGEVLGTALPRVPVSDLVLPVPLHRERLRSREFNQSLLLAQEVSRFLSLPLSCDNLQRIRPTKPQVELPEKERLTNVRGAFSLRKPDEMEGKKVIVVDDVLTTGATVSECAKVLTRAGAEAVYVLTLARMA